MRLSRARAVLVGALAVLAGSVAVAVPASAQAPSTTHGVRATCPRCDSLVLTTAPGSSRAASTSSPAGLSPTDLAHAFDLPTTTSGPHNTIAIIDAGVDPLLDSDLAVYRRQFGLPACTVANGCLRLLDYTGGRQPAPPTSGSGTYYNEQVAVETSLDMDAASAACPSCRLLEISLPWQAAISDNDVSTGAFARAVRLAVAQGAGAVSISYGFTADQFSTSGQVLNAFTQPGVALVASTGDYGYEGARGQSWPADLPGVVATGGTTLHADNSQTGWAGAGSGCAPQFAAAEGQPAAVTAKCRGHRAASDVSAVADPSTGLSVYDTYAPYTHQPNRWIVVGGTSAAAPFIAGLFARGNHLSAVSGPSTLYAAPASDWTDVTAGPSNGDCSVYPSSAPPVCQPGPGWDGPTGLGVPHGLAAFEFTPEV